jgi:hypothetical protein
MIKISICVSILFLLTFDSRGQCDSNVVCCPYLNTICGIDVFSNDSLNKIIDKRIKGRKIVVNTSDDFPYVYFLNSTKTEYLKIYASPGNWYNRYFEVGKPSSELRSNCYLGILSYKTFFSNDSVKLGMTNMEAFKKLPLARFRVFVHNSILYYVSEQGLYGGIDPTSPAVIVYLKFKNEKLIGFGFGSGFPFFNPVFPPKS